MRIAMDVRDKLYLLIKDYGQSKFEHNPLVEHEYLVAASDEDAIKQAELLYAQDFSCCRCEYTLLDVGNAAEYGRKVVVLR